MTDGPILALGEALVDLCHAETAQLLDHEGRGAMALQPQLGVHVKMAPPRLHIGREFRDAVDDGHGHGLLRRDPARLP